MTLRPTALLLFLLVLCLLALAPSGFGQTEAATLSGLVTDPQGKVVPDVAVEITNVETNVRVHQTTNNAGLYVVVGLKPGRYRVSITKDGFRRIDLTDLVLNVQDVLSRNFQLQLGPVTASITVVADEAKVNTTDATVGTIVDHKFVENVPLNGRSFQNLLTLAPGVTTVPIITGGGIGLSGEITVNGQRTEGNYFTVDGVSANTGTAPGYFGVGAGYAGAVPGESSLGTTQSLVSIDALQEFRAATSTYSAEYGRTPGGQFSFATRSGTNQWHGSVYDYLRNDAMDANNWFNSATTPPTPRQAERQNDFGGTLGGPIIVPGLYNGRDKTFFFFSYEGLRLLQPQAVAPVSVPDATLRQTAPDVLRPVLNAFPVPNAGEDGLNDGLAFYNEAASNPSALDSVSARIDHSFGEKFKVFGRYADTPSEASFYVWAVKSTSKISVRTLTLGATSLLTSRQSNELRFNLTQNDARFLLESTNLGGAVPFDLSSIPGPSGDGFPKQGSFFFVCLCYGGFPQFQLSGQPTAQRQYNVTDAYSWALGTHSLKFGVDWRRLASKATPRQTSEYVLYFSEGALLANNVDFAIAQSQAPSLIEPVYTNFSSFVQDDWKAPQRLSVSLGLRWDLNPAPGNALGPSPYTVTQISDLATTHLAPAGTRLWKTTWNNLAPRLGVAYQVRQTPGHETVLRAGFGTFYDMGNPNGSQGFGGVGFNSVLFPSPASFPLTSAQLQVPPPSLAPPYIVSIYAFDPNLKLPYTQQWNLAVEQGLGAKQALTLSYVGSRGRRLLTQFEYFPSGLGNPNFDPSGALFVTTNRASSNYNAFQAQYQKQLSRGLQALASYTWSHSLDNASSNFTIHDLFRASSDFDIRHNFQAAITYDLPGKLTNSVLSAFLTHWGLDTRISAHSSVPVDIIGAQAVDPATQVLVNFRPNLVQGQPSYLFGEYPGGRVINYNAFTPAPANTQGDTPRNYARGFNAVQADLALRREFPIHERLRLQFRAEAFNVFNHPIFGSIFNHLSNGPQQFGYAFSTLNNSLGGLSPLYQIGGPRSLQVMLRVTF